MEQVIQNQLLTAAVQLERTLDAEIERIDNLGLDDLDKIRENRLKELKKQAQQKQEYLNIGHGEYAELADEKEFLRSRRKVKILCVISIGT